MNNLLFMHSLFCGNRINLSHYLRVMDNRPKCTRIDLNLKNYTFTSLVVYGNLLSLGIKRPKKFGMVFDLKNLQARFKM